MKPTPLYRRLASLLQAARNCDAAKNAEWAARHRNTIRDLVKQHMPEGSGFDSGTELDEDASTPEKLVFTTSFHHMNDGGMYDGWTEHKVTVTPSLAFGYELRVSGRDRNGIKDYIAETFGHALDTEV